MPIFYFFGLCYISMRIYSNVFGTLLPFYLISVLKLGSSDKDKLSFSIALVPLISFLFSAITSSGLNFIYEKIGRKKSLFMGTTICVISMIMIYFTNEHNAILIYFIAALIGISQAMVLGTGVNLIS
jgi:Na+/melibiose symporter-like transporter